MSKQLLADCQRAAIRQTVAVAAYRLGIHDCNKNIDRGQPMPPEYWAGFGSEYQNRIERILRAEQQ